MVKQVALGIVLTGLALPLLGAGSGRAQKPAASIVVYKDPGCGCCEKWVDHLKAHGFVATVSEADMDAVKAKYKVPAAGRSCHTAIVDGYVIEGHVPAADIQRLLRERPAAVVGIAVPGMPIGSPGMEIDGVKADAFNSVAWDKDGKATVFAKH